MAGAGDPVLLPAPASHSDASHAGTANIAVHTISQETGNVK
jgi:hypothetical protein